MPTSLLYVALISIHAPLTGCDYVFGAKNQATAISIHAPLTGCDQICVDIFVRKDYFNPRTPHGVRLALPDSVSARKAISIHAPLTGCDSGFAM